MKVQFQRLMCNPTRTVRPGQVVDLPEAEAAKRIAAGHCVPADAPGRRGLADRLRGRRKDPQPAGPEDDDRPLQDYTVAQLKAYADAHGIDLQGATRKTSILRAIENARTDQDTDDG